MLQNMQNHGSSMLSVERKYTLGKISQSVGQIIQLFPEIEMYLTTVKNSANILK